MYVCALKVVFVDNILRCIFNALIAFVCCVLIVINYNYITFLRRWRRYGAGQS